MNVKHVFYIVSPYEWVLSNSVGGYALGTASMLNHRKYHGLLVASRPDFRRIHIVSGIEEMVEFDKGPPFFLDSNNYPNVIYPQGHRNMVKYFFRPFPSFLYSSIPFPYEALMLKVVKMHPHMNCSVVKYRNLGRGAVRLVLRPKFTLRDHHGVHDPGYWDTVKYELGVRDGIGRIASGGIEAFVFSPGGKFEADPRVYRSVVYPTEMLRGYEAVEDLLAPFKIVADLNPGQEEVLLFGVREGDFEKAILETEQRYEPYPLPSSHPLNFKDSPENIYSNLIRIEGEFGNEEYAKILELAMSEFIANDDLVAGFPWFSAWGRDTMIAMEALKYIEGGRDLSRRILKKYAAGMVEGIIPNTLGEGKGGRNYETVDASLWFGMRVLELWEEFADDEKSKMIEAVSQVILNYIFNDSLPFHVDSQDGLINIKRNSGLGLTWMDAKINGVPVTPRYGKPVEVNALWYNLLRYFMVLAGKEGIDRIRCRGYSCSISRLRSLSRKAKKSLRMYCNGRDFADRIEDGRLINELRPNYLIALSLPFDVFSKEEIKVGYTVSREKLLTAYGLRSLSPERSAFRGKYMGNQRMRDLAYHQGAVWVWLLLPMAKVASKVYRRERDYLAGELEELISAFRYGLVRGEMASVSELYDGNAPRLPKGAPAQCWSVAAVFLIEKMLEDLRAEQ